MEIPGYEWNEATQRYFKITSTGEMPSGAYTIAALAKKKRKEERERISAFQYEKQMNGLGYYQRDTTYGAARAVDKLGKHPRPAVPEFSPCKITSFVMVPTPDFEPVEETSWDPITVSSYTPVCGYEDGSMSSSDYCWTWGRSIADMTYNETQGIVAAAGDDDRESVVGNSHGCRINLGYNQVSQITLLSDSQIAIASAGRALLWSLGETPMLTRLDHLAGTDITHSICAMNETTLVAGGTMGTVHTIDTRTLTCSLQFRFPNERMVTNVAMMEPNLVVCTGLEDQMFLLDLRVSDADRAVRRYAYENWSHVKHGLSISPNSGSKAIAVAQENGIRFFDIEGDILNTVPIDETPSPCLQWTEDGLYYADKNRLMLMAKQRFYANRIDKAEVTELFNQLNSTTPYL